METKRQLDYPAIRAWGEFTGSSKHYVQAEVRRARRDEAPWDATTYEGNGNWHRLRDVTSLSALNFMRVNYPELMERLDEDLNVDPTIITYIVHIKAPKDLTEDQWDEACSEVSSALDHDDLKTFVEESLDIIPPGFGITVEVNEGETK